MDRRVGIQGKSTVRTLPLSMGLEDFDKASKFVEIPGCAIVHWHTREMIRTSYCMILTCVLRGLSSQGGRLVAELIRIYEA